MGKADKDSRIVVSRLEDGNGKGNESVYFQKRFSLTLFLSDNTVAIGVSGISLMTSA